MRNFKLFFVIFLIIAVALCFSFVLAYKSIARAEKNQNQNQEIEGEDDDDEDETEEELASRSGQANAELHRSVVANFVQSLLKVASRSEGGIGEQVRVVAQEQNNFKEEEADAIEKIQKRSKIKTFLIGSDYKNLGQLRSSMVQTRNRIEQLTRLMEQTQNQADKTELQNQIQELEQERTRIENFIKAQEGKFSLFGWLVKLFTKD